MKSRYLLLCFAVSLLFLHDSTAQQKHRSKVYLAQQFSKYEVLVPHVTPDAFFNHPSIDLGLSPASKMRLDKTIEGLNGHLHYRYQQTHEGLPVIGASYVLHSFNGEVIRSNGRIEPLIDQDTEPSIEAGIAVRLTKQKIKALEVFDPTMPATLVWIDPAYPSQSESIRLAYQIDLETRHPYDKQRYYVDAHDGNIIYQSALIHKEGVPSTAVTKYYGTQSIITDSIGPQAYVLKDPTRGDGISIYDFDDNAFTNNSSHWDLSNSRQDEVALDAHYCTQQFYDLLLEHHDWHGLDDQGGEMIVHVHNNNAGTVNAFWNGESTNYGDGDCLRGPLTTLEVVGHEWTHGVISNSSKLIYSGESGAINESLADMMGKTLERYEAPADFSWDLGHSFLLSPDAEPFRIMDDPASVNMPPFYKGDLWQDGGGVHTNSAVGNLWFTMIVDGKQGVNEIGENFDVPAIGIEKASKIAFHCNRAYLTENSSYNDFYLFSIQTAEELYGAGGPEAVAIEKAWNAVGLPTNTQNGPNLDLSVDGPFVFNRRCGLDEYYTVRIPVSNLGITAYDSSMNAQILVSGSFTSLNDTTISIVDSIMPGEVLIIELDNWLTSELPTSVNVPIELDFVDDDQNNNNDYLYYQIYEFQSSDLALFVDLGSTKCFTDSTEIYFSIYNSSCDSIAANTIVDLVVSDQNGAILWSGPHTLEDGIRPFRRVIASYNIALGLTQSEDLRYEVAFSDDPDTDNNFENAFTPFIEVVESDYLNPFTDQSILDDEINYSNDGITPISLYQNESYFSVTGVIPDPEFITPCPDAESSFNNGTGFFSGIYGRVNLCLDLTNAPSPYLSFDVVQFRNDLATSENNDYTAMLQAKWLGTSDGGNIVFGQPEGELMHYDYDLPTGFKGELELKFYTASGQYDGNNAPDTNFDVVMLDNLAIQTDFTNTTELENGKNIFLSPNPASQDMLVQSNTSMQTIEISNMNGQLLKQIKVGSHQFNLDLSTYSEGMYLLRVLSSDGQWAIKKFVKL